MFSTDDNAVLKWCLNRPEQSKSTTALKELASISTSQHVYRQLRPSYILKVEKLVTKTTRVLEEEYLNPFFETIDESLLHNLSSGTPLPNALTDDILKVYSEGTKQMNAFKKRFVQTDADRSTNGEPVSQEEEKREHEDIGEEEQEEGITDIQADEEDDGGSTNTTETPLKWNGRLQRVKSFMIPFREIVSSHLRILRLTKLSRWAIKRQQYLSIMTLLDHSARFLRHMRSYFGICYRHSLKPIIESTSLQTHINLLPSRAEKEKNEDVATKSL